MEKRMKLREKVERQGVRARTERNPNNTML